MRRLITLLGGVVALAVVAANAGASTAASFPLRLSATNLPQLTGARYEAWVVFGSQKVSAGKFDVTASGAVKDRLASPRDPGQADAIAISIEPRADRNRGPSSTIVLAGKPKGRTAKLAFPFDLRKVGGTYLLATPSDDDTTNEAAGIWFSTTTGKASLRLPAAPAGWAWEGWGVTQGTPLSTGRFARVTGADRSAPFSGPNPVPALPGEDFVKELPSGLALPLNLADGSSLVVISLEPDQNGKDPTGPGPFTFKPLVGKVPAGLNDHVSRSLRRDLTGLPRGSVRF